MQNINGTNYVSFKEYAELKGKTAGRIYQLKNELPVVKFEDLGVELINFDLLQLNETEVNLAQSKFQTTQALHTYDHKQLSLFFADMIKGNFEARSNAETLLREKELVLEEQGKLVLELTEKNKSLDALLFQAQEENLGLAETLQEKTTALEKADALIAVQNLDLLALSTDKSEALALVESLKLSQQKLQTDYDLKAAENVGLIKEQTFTAAQIEGLNKEIEKLQKGMESLNQEHQKVLGQKEDLNVLLNETKTSQQKTLHDLELKGFEIQGLMKDNTSLQSQVAALNQKLQEEQSFNQRLGKLEEMLLKEGGKV
jgi:chromosome segregation ATPase